MHGDTAAADAFKNLVIVTMDPQNGYGTVIAGGEASGYTRGDRVKILHEPVFHYMERPIFHSSQVQRA